VLSRFCAILRSSDIDSLYTYLFEKEVRDQRRVPTESGKVWEKFFWSVGMEKENIFPAFDLFTCHFVLFYLRLIILLSSC